VKDRIENLYFAYLFVLRAVMKAGPYLESAQYTTGVAEHDSHTLTLVQQLVMFAPSSFNNFSMYFTIHCRSNSHTLTLVQQLVMFAPSFNDFSMYLQ